MRFFLGLVVLMMMAGCSSKQKSGDAAAASINSQIEIITDMANFNQLINGSTPVLVDFYADWCAPCRMVAPILEQVASSLDGSVKIIKVDVDKNQQAAAKYGVRSIPTLILFQNGEIKWQGVGVIQADQIEQIVKSNTSS
jgi:thioredoxin 1